MQHSLQAKGDKGIMLAEIRRGEAIYLFIISQHWGMHYCMLPVQKNQPIDVLMDHLSKEAIRNLSVRMEAVNLT